MTWIMIMTMRAQIWIRIMTRFLVKVEMKMGKKTIMDKMKINNKIILVGDKIIISNKITNHNFVLKLEIFLGSFLKAKIALPNNKSLSKLSLSL